MCVGILIMQPVFEWAAIAMWKLVNHENVSSGSNDVVGNILFKPL